MAWRTANFADPICQFWLVFAGIPSRIFKKVRIILRPKFTNLKFRLPTIYINQLTRKKPETLLTTKWYRSNQGLVFPSVPWGCSLLWGISRVPWGYHEYHGDILNTIMLVGGYYEYHGGRSVPWRYSDNKRYWSPPPPPPKVLNTVLLILFFHKLQFFSFCKLQFFSFRDIQFFLLYKIQFSHYAKYS